MKNKVLLVEDTLEILHNLSDYFMMEGFEVVTAHNGKEALKQLEQFHPDVMITDLLMDEMTGFELVKAIRHQPKYKSLKILVFSARPKEEDEEIAQLEMDDYLLKPANPEIILERVRLLLSSDLS